ncbi:CPBP family intramembrane glutamic endopeptidase [Enterococcus sp. LJL90]
MKDRLQIMLLVIFFFTIQEVPMSINLIVLSMIAILFFKKRTRLVGFLFALSIGHVLWLAIFESLKLILDLDYISQNQFTILQRLGLAGYLIAFYVFTKKFKTDTPFSLLANVKTSVQMPFFFSGSRNEKISRFLMIYLSSFSLAIFSTLFFVKLDFGIILFAISFSFVNSILEEILWRYFILNHLSMLYSKQSLLVSNALLFGIFHLSLGFPLTVCLVYAIGGYFMSGITYFSKGLLPTFLMHGIVNIFFVFVGIIPFK